MAKNKKVKKAAKKTSKSASKSASKPLKAKIKKAPPKLAAKAKAPPKKLEKPKGKATPPAKAVVAKSVGVKGAVLAKVSAIPPKKGGKAEVAPLKTTGKDQLKVQLKAPLKAPTKIPEVVPVGKKAKNQAAKQMIREALSEAVMAALPEKEVVLTNADGLRYCKVSECDELATSDTYCRFHYLLNWKKIQLRKKILAGDKLDRYIEELTSRYPDKFLEVIRRDLASEKDFLAAIQELEIDDSGDDVEFEDDARTYIDEVRGVSSGTEDEEF